MSVMGTGCERDANVGSGEGKIFSNKFDFYRKILAYSKYLL